MAGGGSGGDGFTIGEGGLVDVRATATASRMPDALVRTSVLSGVCLVGATNAVTVSRLSSHVGADLSSAMPGPPVEPDAFARKDSTAVSPDEDDRPDVKQNDGAASEAATDVMAAVFFC